MPYLHCRHAKIGMVAAFILAALSGCASFEQKEDSQVVALRRDLSRIGDWSAANQEKIQEVNEHVQALEAQIKEIQNTIVEMPGHGESKTLETETSIHERSLESVTARTSKKTPAQTMVAAAPKPDRPAQKSQKKAPDPSRREYEEAYAAYKEHRHDKALALFKRFYKRYPGHNLADNAQYWIGEIYYDQEDYPNAILVFKEVVTRHAEGNKASGALLKIGFSYVGLDDPANARVFLKRVIKNYPFSESEAKARAKLKEIENL